jgi:glycerophosphoryl diester phosphodiesterase
MTQMKIIGHRGASAVKPENTMAAFDKALFDGAFGFELDVRRCKGNENMLAVLHDSTVNRTTNGTGRVKRLTAEELAKLDAGDGEHVPMLPEVLETFKGRAQIFIEIKSRQIAADIAASVTEAVMMGGYEYADLVVICQYPDVLHIVQDVNSEIVTGLHLIELEEDVDVAENKSIQPFDKYNATEDVLAAIADVKPNYLLPSVGVVSSELVKLAHAAGVKVAVWTVNDEAQLKKCVAADADIVITDNVAEIKRMMKAL